MERILCLFGKHKFPISLTQWDEYLVCLRCGKRYTFGMGAEYDGKKGSITIEGTFADWLAIIPPSISIWCKYD